LFGSDGELEGVCRDDLEFGVFGDLPGLGDGFELLAIDSDNACWRKDSNRFGGFANQILRLFTQLAGGGGYLASQEKALSGGSFREDLKLDVEDDDGGSERDEDGDKALGGSEFREGEHASGEKQDAGGDAEDPSGQHDFESEEKKPEGEKKDD